MVRNAFHIGDQIVPHKPDLNAAIALTQPLDVTRAQKLLHLVDHLLQGLNAIRNTDIVFREGHKGKRNDL